MPHSLVGSYQRFGGIYRLHLQVNTYKTARHTTQKATFDFDYVVII
jgi:hypothetical protein